MCGLADTVKIVVEQKKIEDKILQFSSRVSLYRGHTKL